MIYSKFGSRLTPISKSENASGQFTIQATADDTTEIREYQTGDLKADDGHVEINEILAKLPLKVVKTRSSPGKRTAENH